MRRGDLAGIILLAIRYRPVERVSGLPLAGVVLGLVGVGVLATLFCFSTPASRSAAGRRPRPRDCPRRPGCRLRRAEPHDLDFLVALAEHEDVEPYMSVSRPRDRESVAAEIERSRARPEEHGRLVIEIEEDGEWRLAGTLGYELGSARSGIANLGGFALAPGYRGRGIADAASRAFQRHLIFDLGFHRLQLECYDFNERGIRQAERAGFVREGVKRRAYWRHGRWTDGILFGLVREDLEER